MKTVKDGCVRACVYVCMMCICVYVEREECNVDVHAVFAVYSNVLNGT